MKKSFLSFLLVICVLTVFCKYAVGDGTVTQTTSSTTTSGKTQTTTTITSSSGANSGGGVNYAPCQGKSLGALCDTDKGRGTCRSSSDGLVCVMQTCYNDKGYYKEHYTLTKGRKGTNTCPGNATPISATLDMEGGGGIQICGSKGFCRTKDVAKRANKCSTDVNIVTLSSGEKVIAGCVDSNVHAIVCGSLEVMEDGVCRPCDDCENSPGCTCTVSVINNRCVYTTTPQQGYSLTSGDGTNNPVCQQETQCPDGSTGTPPNCNCNPPKTRYVQETNSCECPEDKPVFRDGQCIAETQCPDGSTGTPPNCNCKSPKTRYVQETNSCACPEDKPSFDGGQCIAKCPDDATGTYPNCKCKDSKKIYDKNKNQCVEDKLQSLKDKYESAKANEQSLANRTLTAATTAATGIGAMQLAQGLAEKSADAKADRDMAAYIETMRCTYANGKSVKMSEELVELPGGNDAKIMQYRNEYFALATDLKERKESLGMKPGIESETIFDKANTGLYDDENVGISGGKYGSLYRAKMGSEDDQAMIDSDKEASANRVKGGAIAVGAGAVVGVAGDSLINGELGKKIENLKEKSKEELNNAISGYDSTKSSVVQHKDPVELESKAEVSTEIGAYADFVSESGVDKSELTGQELDEPKVDSSKWSKEKYQQCFKNFSRKNDKYSSNVKSYWARSHNGKYCSGYTNGKYIYDFKKNPNPCNKQKEFNAISNGEWKVALRNGKTMKGIAVCSDTQGSEDDELRDEINTNSNNGLNCWCKITQTDLSECLVTQKFSWQYKGNFGLVDASDVEMFNDNRSNPESSFYPAEYYIVGQNNCLWQCADECAYGLFDYGLHRQRQMHGVPLMVDYIKDMWQE